MTLFPTDSEEGQSLVSVDGFSSRLVYDSVSP